MSKISAHFVAPSSGRGPCVLVLHSWWGLNEHFRRLCSDLAKAGYLAVAPDLFGGRTARTVAEARRLRAEATAQRREPAYKLQIRVLEEALASGRALGSTASVIGFSMGGHWALWLAQRQDLPLERTVVYYAVRNGNYTHSRSSFMFHLAEHDEWVSSAGTKKLQRSLEEAQRPAVFYNYAGTEHWFFERGPEKTYNAAAAQLSWARTLAFLRAGLGDARGAGP
ncbi:MAG: dienelactone hydrolase family protein [Burkholderiaceae bacterium]|nr:dienelactone hydrolase family protein [Burkholderiaceae bacterium]